MNPYKREYTEESFVPKCDCNKRENLLMSISLYTVCFCIISIFAIEVIKELKIFIIEEIPINPYIIIILSGISLAALFFGIGLSKWKN